ncbi:hypothetical protein H0H87_011302 [Tephrocybe sp. NHM501043]|nr:hypothetical protein H0H87_011302 [Tephrocybe sp. NHM501043]
MQEVIAVEPVKENRKQDWTETYKALLTYALLNAADPIPFQPPQIFYVKLSMSFSINPDIKARSALRLEDAELLALEEFRRATVNKSHRLYSEENGQLLDGFNKRMQYGMRFGPYERFTMIVERLEVYQDGLVMSYFKSWFHEGGSATYPELGGGTWLSYLKERVASGKGWSRS